MIFITYYDLELYNINMKITFLIGIIDEKFYIEQPKILIKKRKKFFTCKL